MKYTIVDYFGYDLSPRERMKAIKQAGFDGVILLDMPETVSTALVRRRSEATGRIMDIHELDTEYLTRCRSAASYTAETCGWTVIRCAEDGAEEPRSREEIAADVARAADRILKK